MNKDSNLSMKDALLKLVGYDGWATKRVIDSLLKINRPPERALQVMGHILSAQEVWLDRIQGATIQAAVWQTIPLDQVAQKAAILHQRSQAYLAGLADCHLTEVVSYKNSKGDAFENTVQDIFLQLSHHAAYHRGQVIQLIRPYLDDVPQTDYIFWIRER